MPTPQRIDIEGRPHVNRAEIARITGMAEQSQANLYATRETNGYPEGIRIGRGLWFDEQVTLSWYRDWDQAKRATLTEVDRGGDPDELLDTAGATALLGYTNTSTIRGFLARNDDYFPDPDEVEELPSGRVRRRWTRRTLWAFAERRSRPGRGGVGAHHIPPETKR